MTWQGEHLATPSYGTVGSNRLEHAKVGVVAMFEHPSGGRIYGQGGNLYFGVLGPHNSEPATVGNSSMVAFRFDTREQVDPMSISM